VIMKKFIAVLKMLKAKYDLEAAVFWYWFATAQRLGR
jgi:hypothetical protein